MEQRRGGFRAALIVALMLAALAVPASAEAAPTPLAQVGTPGSGAGQLSGAVGVTVDPGGNLYVADSNNNRISVFSSNGTFIHAFGFGVDTGANVFEVCTAASTCQAGPGLATGAGGLRIPQSVALDGAGRLYVADFSNNRISVFDPQTPAFIHAFGFGVDTGANAFQVCTAASTCQSGGAGGGGGQLSSPLGIAFDGAGNLHVADFSNHRVSIFNPAGPSFVRAFGRDVAAPNGGTVLEFCPTQGACLAGDSGSGAGEFNSPQDLDFNAAGELHVADRDNNRVNVFDSTATAFVRSFGGDVANPPGGTGLEICPTQGTCKIGISGGSGGLFNDPSGLAFDAAGKLNVIEQGGHRVSVITSPPAFVHTFGYGVATGASAFEVCATAASCQVGINGSGIGQLSLPREADTDCQSAVWVADSGNGRIQRFGEPATPLCVPPTPPAPVLTDSDPDSPADDASPEIKGTAEPGSRVTLFTNAACSGTAVGAGTAAEFANPGITVSVADNSTTTFFARVTKAFVNSPCSALGLTYQEVTPPPPSPLPPPVVTTTANPPAFDLAAAIKKCKKKFRKGKKRKKCIKRAKKRAGA